MSSKTIFSNTKYQAIKLTFCLAVILVVAKPFVGFVCFSALHPPTAQTVLIKAFSKRKQEYIEDSKLDSDNAQKRLADPILKSCLLFSFFLSIIFPLLFKAEKNVTGHLLALIRFSLAPQEDTYLIGGKLSI